MANWNWKVVREFVHRHFGRPDASGSSCLNYLHRLGFVLKRPKKRLLKAKAADREAFVACPDKSGLRLEAEARSAKIFFADEAHFRADADLRGKWVLRGQPAPRSPSGSKVGREGQLLLGSLLGDWRGGSNGSP